ncbi:MAG: hypothetical protein Q9209_005454 [Squamulea sp. 1 TL-2023]
MAAEKKYPIASLGLPQSMLKMVTPAQIQYSTKSTDTLKKLPVLDKSMTTYWTDRHSYNSFHTLKSKLPEHRREWGDFEEMINTRVSAIEIEFKTNSYSDYSDSADTFAKNLQAVSDKVKIGVGCIVELEEKMLRKMEEYYELCQFQASLMDKSLHASEGIRIQKRKEITQTRTGSWIFEKDAGTLSSAIIGAIQGQV